jgi:hypothetical protein
MFISSFRNCWEALADTRVNRDGNKLSYLTGIPGGVLRLFASSNRLTSLSSLDHLRKLQVLDLSNNQLDSLTRELNRISLEAGLMRFATRFGIFEPVKGVESGWESDKQFKGN